MPNDDPNASDFGGPNPSPGGDRPKPDLEALYGVISHVGLGLGFTFEEVSMGSLDELSGDDDPLYTLKIGSEQVGISLTEIFTDDADELFAFVRESFPVIFAQPDGSFVVLEKMAGRKVDAMEIGGKSTPLLLRKNKVQAFLNADVQPRIFVAKKQLECDTISGAPAHRGHDHHAHLSPVRRFWGLLSLDRRDITMVVLFAFVAGVLALATPLAIESLVNVVSWGTYFQPLLILAIMLLTCLGLAGVLRILQTVVVEIIQRRQFVRIVSDLSHRFPRANQASISREYPRELANRVFDIMTIQKATATLLVDGVTIVLTTLIGLVLLAFYHPFLLGFDIVLVLSMISITWVLGRGGIRTAIEESMSKYRVAHWLQDVIASPSAFKINGGESLAIQRANQLTAEYIAARRKQFRVVLRQIIFAIGLQVVASTVVLGLGGYLVIQGQLTLGQLVASELVVTVIVGAFAKAGKSLEKFYDLMAGVDKVGHLLDVPPDPRIELTVLPAGPAEASWSDLQFKHVTGVSKIPATEISPGSCTAVIGDDIAGRRALMRALGGLLQPTGGHLEIAGYDAFQAASGGNGRLVGFAGDLEIFHGSLRDNVDLGRSRVGQNRVRESLQDVGLWTDVLKTPGGLMTRLQTGGYPLTYPQKLQLILARAIASRPRLLLVDGLLDELNDDQRDEIWTMLTDPGAPWTLLVSTSLQDIASRCENQVSVRRG